VRTAVQVSEGRRAGVTNLPYVPSLHVTHYSDPHCPWAWSASPALSTLRWRYGDQLVWRHVMIGLTESRDVYAARGYSPTRSSLGYRSFRKRGMPFATQPRDHLNGTWAACRVVVATRRLAPERELAVFRALQFAQFTSTADLENPADQKEAIAWVPGIDADAIVAAATDPETEALFEADREEARSAAGSPTEFQGKAAKYSSDQDRVRYTAPSLRFTTPDARTLEAGGFQPLEAYDVLIANLDTDLERRSPAEDAAEILPEFPDGLTTAEVALIMTPNNGWPDLGRAEDSLIALTGERDAVRVPFGHDALWLPATSPAVETTRREAVGATA
jgi:2-hydroxychromene-2-carboxylate isomerase